MIDKKILCIIPARGGSKSVPKKNIRNLGNKPLIQWTIDEAKKSKYIDRMVVSTEDREIEKVCTSLGIEVIKRPMELATDDSPTIDSILYTLDILEKDKKYYPDYILLLQCTSPFRTVEDIDKSIEALLNNESDMSSLLSVTKEEYPAWWLKEINEDGTLSDFISYDKQQYSRRQSFPPLYKLNGAIYLCEINQLRKSRTFQTESSIAYIMDNNSSIDIDTEDDLKWAEYLILRSNE
ncbi:MAG: acylneuraminate cytidylyltransferase family protein [Tissierella sp.]|nr:acylneuraminate cytidylyltransferase family protein [Tissierella sp.]